MEPIAIVGMVCRFPKAPDCASFWHLLRAGMTAVVPTPADRWDAAALYDPDPEVPGKMNSRWGGFLEGVDQFDRDFFKLSPREANRLDPQQRLLLELAWEALEDAGQVPNRLRSLAVGVFIGMTNFDYLRFALDDLWQVDSYSLSGGGLGMAANRLSYHLDLSGPSMAIDTACSSGLVAVHLACQSLQLRVGQRPTRLPRLAFVFAGYGSQWPGMGRRLLGQPVFRASLEESDRCLRAVAPWSLLDVVKDPTQESRLLEPAIGGPVLFALQAGLAALWRSWGVVPDGVIGCGMGEIAAAHYRGSLNLPEALKAVHSGEWAGDSQSVSCLFAQGLNRLLDEPYGLFLEISPHPVLAGVVEACLRARGHKGLVLPSCKRGQEEDADMLTSLGMLFTRGWPVEWTGLYPTGRVVSLPSYPWQRQRCWLESRCHTPSDL